MPRLGVNGRMAAYGSLSVLAAGLLTAGGALTLEDPAQAAASAGGHHTCVLTPDGEARCWGTNTSGQVGDGTTTSRTTPVPVRTSSAFTDIATGSWHTCALSTGGKAYCWGGNGHGQLGNGATTSTSTPVPVQTSLAFTSISANGDTTCALTRGGKAYCWGRNDYGQVGKGTVTERESIPVPVSTTGVAGGAFASVSVGGYHTCGFSTGRRAYCWGSRAFGQTGAAATSSDLSREPAPVAVDVTRDLPDGTTSAIALSGVVAGRFHTCALSTGGAALCWGFNGHGQIGNGEAGTSPIPEPLVNPIPASLIVPAPVAVSTAGALAGVRLTGISPGYRHTCARSAAGRTYCWGDNEDGKLGNATSGDSPKPVAVSTADALAGVTLTNVSAGYWHTCAEAAAPWRVYCWGNNGSGRIGDGQTTSRTSPVLVLTVRPPDPPAEVTAVPGPNSATITWSAGPAAATEGVMRYVVTANPGGASCESSDPASQTCTITGLQEGTEYTFTVVVVTEGGASTPSGPSNRVLPYGPQEAAPAGPPDPPTNIIATPGPGVNEVTVSWTPGALNRGRFQRSTVTATPGGRSCVSTLETVHSCVVTGLVQTRPASRASQQTLPEQLRRTGTTFGPTAPTRLTNLTQATRAYTAARSTAYTFTVVTTTDLGESAVSAASAPVLPKYAPDTPTAVTTVPGDRLAKVSWKQPANLGTGTLKYYLACAFPQDAEDDGSCSPSADVPRLPAAPHCTSRGTECTIPNLHNGTIYRVKAFAVTSDGVSQPSQWSNLVTPGNPEAGSTPPKGDGLLLVTSSGEEITAPVTAGGVIRLMGRGFAPNTPVKIYIYSAPELLRGVVSDARGGFDLELRLGVEFAGDHTLAALGCGPEGDLFTLVSPITVLSPRAVVIPAHALQSPDASVPVTAITIAVTAAGALLLLGLIYSTTVRRRRAKAVPVAEPVRTSSSTPGA
ncbi:MAG: fibronectin type III domain-containing protein [Micromonosporaceae bacterium]|nr:fibronectin type III domain-containing protein [Micromonosporaceae bacterium]